MTSIAGRGGNVERNAFAPPHMSSETPGGEKDMGKKGRFGPGGAAVRRQAQPAPLGGLESRARVLRPHVLDVDAAVAGADVAIARAAQIFDMLNDPYVAEKPLLDRAESWVVEQLGNMKQGNFVTQNGGEYVNRVGKASTDHIHTAWIALSGDSVRAAHTAEQHFGGAPRVNVLGTNERLREHEQRFTRYDDADVFVLPEGGPHAPQQFLEVLRYLMAGMTDEQPAERRPKALIVTNYGFYRPLLVGLFGLPPKEVPVREYYRQALEKVIGTASDGSVRAKVVLAERLEQIPASRAYVDETKHGDALPTRHAPEEILVSHLFFGSAQQHKLDHWDNAFGDDVRLMTLIETNLPLGEPIEDYHAYEANSGGKSPDLDGVSGKAESFYRTIYQAAIDEHPTTSRAELLERAEELGVGPIVTIMSDDRGVEIEDWELIAPHFPQELLEKFFEEVERQVGGHDPALQPTPGPETTWLINKCGGVSSALELIDKAYDGYEEATGTRLKRRIRSVCTVTLVQIDLGKDAQSAREAKPTVRNFSGSTTYALRKPGENADASDSFAWCVPEGEIGIDNRSVAERIEQGIDGAYSQELPWMKVKDAMEASGVRFARRIERLGVPDYRIHTFGDPESSRLGRAWQRHVRDFAISSGRKLAPARPVDSAAMRLAAAPAAARSPFDPHAIELQMSSNDALVFARTPDESLGRSKLAYEYFSAKVARHEHGDRKGMLLLVNGRDPGLMILQRLSDTIYGTGLAEKPSLLTAVYLDDEHGSKRVRKHWERYGRVPASPSSPMDTFDAGAELNIGRTERRPAVAYFCSARSVEMDLAAEAEAIGRLLAENGLDMTYGGGSKGMMGLASRSFVETARRTGSGSRLAGISTPMVIKLETSDGKVPTWVDVGHIAPDIVARMKKIIQPADCLIVDKGGDGTLQELAIAVALKEAGDPSMQGKPIIILNAPMSRGQKIFDPFMELYGSFPDRSDGRVEELLEAGREERIEEGREVLSRLGVHVIETQTGEGLEEEVARVLQI